MLRCLKWFPFALVGVFAAFSALSWWVFRRPAVPPVKLDYDFRITLRAFNTAGNEIAVVITSPETGTTVSPGQRWLFTKTVGSHLKVHLQPKEKVYGGPRDIDLVWMTDDAYEKWLKEGLPAEMKANGATPAAIATVQHTLAGQYSRKAHNYDYAVIFAPVKPK